MFHHIAAFSICIEDSKQNISVRMFLLLGAVKPFLDDTFQSKKYILFLQKFFYFNGLFNIKLSH